MSRGEGLGYNSQYNSDRNQESEEQLRENLVQKVFENTSDKTQVIGLNQMMDKMFILQQEPAEFSNKDSHTQERVDTMLERFALSNAENSRNPMEATYILRDLTDRYNALVEHQEGSNANYKTDHLPEPYQDQHQVFEALGKHFHQQEDYPTTITEPEMQHRIDHFIAMPSDENNRDLKTAYTIVSMGRTEDFKREALAEATLTFNTATAITNAERAQEDIKRMEKVASAGANSEDKIQTIQEYVGNLRDYIALEARWMQENNPQALNDPSTDRLFEVPNDAFFKQLQPEVDYSLAHSASDTAQSQFEITDAEVANFNVLDKPDGNQETFTLADLDEYTYQADEVDELRERNNCLEFILGQLTHAMKAQGIEVNESFEISNLTGPNAAALQDMAAYHEASHLILSVTTEKGISMNFGRP